MNKDVIYIDVDDDVTAIIGKIKKAKEKIVAVVPPKRAGTLQSAVNLRLLDRMAKADKKQLVLITNNQALIALAANALIPVAKNLQTKPEVAEIAAIAIDDEDDIINGADLPVGDHANSIKVKDSTRASSGVRSDAIESMDIDGNEEDTAISEGLATAPVTYGTPPKKPSSGNGKSKVKIPNFDKFRKRLFLGIGGGILLAALLVWMFVFAPAATIIVTAATTPAPVSATLNLGGTTATNYKTGTISSLTQTDKKDETISFAATGTGNVGDKATGSVTFRNCDSSTAVTIPSGTTITSSDGLNYITQADASVGAAVFAHGGVCTSPGTSSAVAISAGDVGSNYNKSANTQFTVSGYTSDMTAIATSAGITGGDSKTVTVVSQADIDQATGQLVGESTDAEKKSLEAKFVNGEKVIDSSFTVSRAAPVSSPVVNAEDDSGKATLTITTTYTVYAVASADLDSYLNSSLASQITDANNQKVYDNGDKNAGFSNFMNQNGALTVVLTATGQIGPKIDETQIKQQVKGKIYGDVQSTLQQINGVQNVDVKFSYFWVRTVPNDTNKITIQFQVQNE
jgi:hypothetical protein